MFLYSPLLLALTFVLKIVVAWDLSVETSVRKVVGFVDSAAPNVNQWLGVPFAEPPVGSLRFLPPVAKLFAGVIDTQKPPLSCQQWLITLPDLCNTLEPGFLPPLYLNVIVHGSHMTIHCSKADFCKLIPDGLSFEHAATILVVHGTAWYGPVQLARVEKGQSILIHAAAGRVGQAAIQTAKHFDMEIIATVGSEVKRKLLCETYIVPDDHILNSRDLSFVKGIKAIDSRSR
ncbi:hypothetical protein MMC17_009296 [Xylographa soralifera]|nr:hypothetical protein [Xylographa soralifera]